MKKIIVIDDDRGSFGENGLTRKLFEKISEKFGYEVVFLLSEEEVINFHLDPTYYGEVALVAHDWDLSTLGEHGVNPRFSSQWSITHLVSLGIPLVVYTSSQKDEVEPVLKRISEFETYKMDTFQIQDMKVSETETVFHAPALKKLAAVKIFLKNQIKQLMEFATDATYKDIYEAAAR